MELLQRLLLAAMLLAAACAGLETTSVFAQENWPSFRGPQADGVAPDHPSIPRTWSKTDNVQWTADIPGWGWSCPVVWGDQVFLTTVVSDEPDKNTPPAKGLYLGQGVREPAQGIHHWLVLCLDLNTGKEKWRHEAHAGLPLVPRHPKSTYASETPATDGERLYVLFGDLGLYCYDLSGQPLWSQPIAAKKTFFDYGAAASPVVHDGQVIVVYDNLDESWIASFDAASGKQLWRTPREETHSWATPLVWKNDLRTEIVVPGKNRNRGYSLAGQLLWEFDGQMSNLVIPSPFAAHGLCYIASGYVGDAHRPTFAIRPGAKGDFTPTPDQPTNEFIAWYQATASAYNTTQIVYGDYLYTLYDRGFLTCHDARTGEEIYGKQRFTPLGSFTASPVACNGLLYCVSEEGLTYVLKAGKEFEIVARNPLDELCLASPAIVGDKLLIRTASHLYCISDQERQPQAKPADPANAASSEETAVAVNQGPAAPVRPGDWATYNYSVNGWRYNSHEQSLSPANVAQLQLQWRFPREDSEVKVGVIHATPSVVDGFVYFGTATYPAFYCLSPAGEIVWKYEVGDIGRRLWRAAEHLRGLVPQDGVYTSALVTHDRVYFGDTFGIMYCLDRATGQEKWQVNSKAESFPGAHSANLVMASPILADGKVVFGGGAFEHAAPLDKNYKCCRGRGFVVALEPDTGELAWKYDVGPTPEKYDPPLVIADDYGEHVFHYGPSTSSVWCTPSWDEKTNTIFFGTDVHNSPRRPTSDDPRIYTEHSAAVIAISAADGREKWIRQLAAGDVWNYTMSPYDSKTGQYKDRSIGDTPKLYEIDMAGQRTPVVGVGCKNGGFYVLHRDTGELIAHTPIYTGEPTGHPKTDPRMLALPSPIGGLQTGCATDGRRVYTNGIDKLPNPASQWSQSNPPTGGRVTAISLDTRQEYWRHERPKIDRIGGTDEKPLFRDCGDPIASGIALANGVLYCTTFSSNQLLCINAESGELLKDISIGPVLSGPCVSGGRVYVGTGNTQFSNTPAEAFFPKRFTGELLVFGLP